MSLSEPLSEEDVIMNSKVNHLYNHDFGTKGKFISVVHHDNEGASLQISPYIQLKITYIRQKEEIHGFEITKLKKSSAKSDYKVTKENVNLSNASLGHIIDFADFIKDLDLKGITERRIKLGDDLLGDIDSETKSKLVTLLSSKNGTEVIKTLLEEGKIVTSEDIVNIGYRKSQLSIFEALLNKKEYWRIYGQEQVSQSEKLDSSKEEKVWQYFFKKNPWIFGYGLDYQYLNILEDEAAVRGADVSGGSEERLDTLAGTSEYTVLIELKKPSTELFEKTENRSNSWRLSKGLIYSKSQILEYKASHLTEWMDEMKRYDSEGKKITQKALDPKAILIIGRNEMFSGDDKTAITKERTFELFCRDSRNITIITYDELLKRARFIVESAKSSS